MNQQRAENILSGQTNLARKVFAAVPKQEYWSVGQISNEMNRVEKHNMSKGEITGCLRSLVDAGLVAEQGVLTFCSKVKPEPMKQGPIMPKAEVAAPAPKASLMDRLFAEAAGLRKTADSLEAIALDVDTAIQEAKQGSTEKLRKLQGAMRELMMEATDG